MSETVITYKFKNGVGRAHIPDLTDEERARRHKQLEKAAARFLMAAERELAEKAACANQ